VTLGHPASAQALARRFGDCARATLRRGALLAAAAIIAAVGCGFVIFAAFAGLRLLLGPELAALGIGTLLLALAALLARSSSTPDGQEQTEASEPLPAFSPTAPPQSSDPATLAVFTAAFVLGRRLADRWRE
jgi:hypothetical protein